MRVIIIGGGYAGVTSALRLGRNARKAGWPVDVTLINDTDQFVERIRLHQAITGQRLQRRPLRPLLARAGVTLIVGHAGNVDPVGQTVSVDGRTLQWDRLVLALGSRSGSFNVAGAADFAESINPDSVPRIAEKLSSLAPGARVVVVGGGLTGIESATEVKETYPGLGVTLVTRRRIADDWSDEGRAHVLKMLRAKGIVLKEGTSVSSVGPGSVETDSGVLMSDFCIWCSGFELPMLARDGGLATTAAGRVLVDPQLRSISYPAIYIAGDIAAPVLDPGDALPLGCKSALPTGAQVGDNVFADLTGRQLVALDTAIPFFCVSLGRRDGLIQFTAVDRTLTGYALTGRLAAVVKELVCKSTWWAIELESRGIRGAVWSKSGQAPQTLDPEQQKLAPHVDSA